MAEIIVKNYRDAYFWEWVLRDGEMKKPWAIAEAKKALRKFYHKPVDTERRIFNNDFDGATVVFPLPENIASMEEADAFFREYEYIHFHPTYYDCSGQTFTAWYKIFQKPDGRFWAYHRFNIDC